MIFTPKQPIKPTSKHYLARQSEYHQWMRTQAPVCTGKVLWMRTYFVSNYEDCNFVLKDPRFVRNRTTATGGSRLPFPVPMPKTLKLLSGSMITDDETCPELKILSSLSIGGRVEKRLFIVV